MAWLRTIKRILRGVFRRKSRSKPLSQNENDAIRMECLRHLRRAYVLVGNCPGPEISVDLASDVGIVYEVLHIEKKEITSPPQMGTFFSPWSTRSLEQNPLDLSYHNAVKLMERHRLIWRDIDVKNSRAAAKVNLLLTEEFARYRRVRHHDGLVCTLNNIAGWHTT